MPPVLDADVKRGLIAFLRQEREAKGVSQRELAKRVGVHQSRICQIENESGKCPIPTYDVIARIGLALGYRMEIKFRKA